MSECGYLVLCFLVHYKTSKCDAPTEENYNLMESSSNASVQFSRAKDGTSYQQLHIMLNMITNEKCVRFH